MTRTGPARVRAIVAKQRAAPPLTVGTALGMAQVQDGSTVAESREGGAAQVAIVNCNVRVRCLLGGTWTKWDALDAYRPRLLTLPCRLVPIELADADPATRTA